MQQPATGDSEEGGRKTKLLALLDRARVNRGLQPEIDGDAAAGPDEALDMKPPFIKTEPTEQPTPVTSNEEEFSHPKCTCNHSHQSSLASNSPLTNLHRGQNIQEPPADSQDTSIASDNDFHSRSHSRTNSESTEMQSSAVVQTAGEDATESEKKYAMVQAENSGQGTDQHLRSRVAVLSSKPTPRIANLTGGSRDGVATLQLLKPLEVPRNGSHPPHPQHQQEEKKQSVREAPTRVPQKEPRRNAPPTNMATFLKNLEHLTPEEYEDSELHSNFLHMMHILIPSNATAALLERRGQPIQNIGHQADCTLSIREPEASPFKDDRLLRIYGKAKSISLAQRLVIACIRAYRAEKHDPNYMDISSETPPVALPATSITKAMSVAVSSTNKPELEITSPFNWMVPREEVGKMMGRQGCILAAIRRDTGASIHVSEDVVPGTNERRVVLSGPVDSIAAALEEIKSKSGGRREVAPSISNGRLGQYFAIPYHSAGFLIGPQGATVKSITERTGARIQIPSAEDLPLGSVNRILHMQGNPKQAEHARRVVSAKLRDYLASVKSPRTLSPSSTGRKGDKVTIKVLLPSRICGLMLDQRGKLIREISEKSGAHTHFLAPHDDENRVCVFTGDMSCVLRAQRLVLQVIAGDAISSKRVAPPRKRKRAHREEEDEYTEMAEGDEYVDDAGLYDDDDIEEEDYYDNGYEEPPRLPVRRQAVRQRSLRRPLQAYDYDDDEEMYRYVDELDGVEYDERPRQLVRRRPVTTRPREYIKDEYAVDEHEHDHDELMTYGVPRPRAPKRPAIVRRQSLRRHQSEYDDDYAYDDFEDDNTYEDDNEVEYEQSIRTRHLLVKRRPVGGRVGDRRQPVIRPGRKVQMVAPRPSPTPRMSSTGRRPNGGSNPRPGNNRNGGTNIRAGAPRSGRGSSRSSSNRGRGNTNKRRRQ
ncbi:unnamed protein product [Phytophthora lilii]|uniref:Unnamed protein product n=1 Tax=Phytophthora lilii TaxID=2077276 RepID=A0A9W6TQL8_9STRA|nr:unnamed protein product [Phytophthora lilii]